jgi:hypothetical protein
VQAAAWAPASAGMALRNGDGDYSFQNTQSVRGGKICTAAAPNQITCSHATCTRLADLSHEAPKTDPPFNDEHALDPRNRMGTGYAATHS